MCAELRAPGTSEGAPEVPAPEVPGTTREVSAPREASGTCSSRFAIGIPIHNEARNIGRLLERLRGDGLVAAGLDRVYVVVSGSTDGSLGVVEDAARRWPLITPIVERRRRGKAAAINLFLRAAKGVDRIVLMSGDVLPEPGAVAEILAALDAPGVGIAGGRPVPSGEATTLIQRVARLQWRLHHQVSLVAPKLGEVVACRNIIGEIPPDTAVDEASLEAALSALGQRLVYVPTAIILNQAPQTVGDFLRQRRRIAAGHRHLMTTRGYRVSTARAPGVLAAVSRHLARHPGEIGVAVVAAALEAWARALGLYDLRIRGRNPYIWDVASSTKNPSSKLEKPR